MEKVIYWIGEAAQLNIKMEFLNSLLKKKIPRGSILIIDDGKAYDKYKTSLSGKFDFKEIDFVNFKNTNVSYDPLKDICNKAEIEELMSCMMYRDSKSYPPAAHLLLKALVTFVYAVLPKESINFKYVFELLKIITNSCDNPIDKLFCEYDIGTAGMCLANGIENKKEWFAEKKAAFSAFDGLISFSDLTATENDDIKYAIRNFRKFRSAPLDIQSEAIILCYDRLSIYDMAETELHTTNVSVNYLDLEEIMSKPTVVFITKTDQPYSVSFLFALLNRLTNLSVKEKIRCEIITNNKPVV